MLGNMTTVHTNKPVVKKEDYGSTQQKESNAVHSYSYHCHFLKILRENNINYMYKLYYVYT